MPIEKTAILTVGGGCFWCMEAIFQQIRGVEKVVVGYSGGTCPGHPTYREVSSGKTGHAEVIQVTYDPTKITHVDLLKVFMSSHNPTLIQGEKFNFGSQYRSIILYHNEEQKAAGETILRELQPQLEKTIVTQLLPMETFFTAEEHHQKYYDKNRDAPFCSAIIDPKLIKLRKIYPKTWQHSGSKGLKDTAAMENLK